DGGQIQEAETANQYFITAPLLPGNYEITVYIGEASMTKKVTISPPLDIPEVKNEETSNILNDLVVKFKDAIEEIGKGDEMDKESEMEEPKAAVLGVSRGELGGRITDSTTCKFEVIGKNIQEKCIIPEIKNHSITATHSTSTGTYIKGS